MIAVLAFLKSHWRPIAVLVALVAAFGAGRFATPTKVITKTEVKTEVQIQTKIVEVEKRVEAKAQVVYVDRIVYKDGTVREHTETRTAETATTDTNEKTNTDEQTKTEAKTEKITINDAPRFTVSLLGGAQLKPSINLIPNAGSLALGLAFQYRIAGPLQIGAFGLTTGAFGVSVGLTF